jgi:hypothetical protein
MNTKIIPLIFTVLLGLSPLIRISREQDYISRDTKLFFILCLIALGFFFWTYHSRVQKTIPKIVPLILIIIGSSFIGSFGFHVVPTLFFLGSVLFGIAVWTMLSHKLVDTRILLLTLVGCIALYSQWGIAQFIAQRDLGMSVIGESRIDPTSRAIASFYLNDQKYIRGYGPFAHSNSLSGSIALGCILLTFIFPKQVGRHQHRVYLYAILAMFALGSLTTFSRAGILASGISLIVIGIRGNYKVFIPIFLSCILFLPILFGRSFDSHGVALADRAEGFTWLREMETPSDLVRGYGIGNYETALKKYLEKNSVPHNMWDIAPIHSVPLLLFTELGAPLFLILCSITILFFLGSSMWIIIALLPPLLLDHYFVTQLGPLLWLITSTILGVQYKREHRTD